MTQADRLRLAVFIDFDNIEIGVRNSLNASFDAGLVLEALKERGEVVSKMAYSDWQRAGGYSRALTLHAIRMVQRNMTPGGDKNGADINLALDALEMAFTHPHINAFVIVGGDSDFISLVEKLKQYDKKVFVVGGRQFTSAIMQRNCHEFIAYENLANVSGGTGRRAAGRDGKAERAGIEQAIPLVRRAMKVLSERDVEPQLGLFKSTLLQLDSTFSERTYGAGSFRDFAQKLEKAGVLTVEHTSSGWIVGPAAQGRGAADDERRPAAGGEEPGTSGAPPPRTAAEGVRELGEILSAAGVRKWPLYLRNVKQLVRQGRPTFDERQYGFANLADLLRAAHREGLVRVDRDRQGVIRVFQGTAGTPEPAIVAPAPVDGEVVVDVEAEPAAVDAAAGKDEPSATLPASTASGSAGARQEPPAEQPPESAAKPAPARRRRRTPASPRARKAATPRRPRKSAPTGEAKG